LGEERDGLPQWHWGRRSRATTDDAINGGALEEELGGDVGTRKWFEKKQSEQIQILGAKSLRAKDLMRAEKDGLQ